MITYYIFEMMSEPRLSQGNTGTVDQLLNSMYIICSLNCLHYLLIVSMYSVFIICLQPWYVNLNRLFDY